MIKRLLEGMALSEEDFRKPGREFGIMPFWMFNSKQERAEIKRQLLEFKDKFIPGFFIHGRYGLLDPYLSPAWFEHVEEVCRQAGEMGLSVWIYDEYNWPSGSAGLQVTQDFPELCQRFIQLVETKAVGPTFTFLKSTDARYLDTDNGTLLAVMAVPIVRGEKDWSRMINLNRLISFNNQIAPWEVPAGEWSVLHFIEKTAPWYIDALNPAAVDKFIEYTHEKYAAKVGKYFGTVIPGFYTDEPAMYYYQVFLDTATVPWTKDLLPLFHHRNGYDLRAELPSLFFDVNERTSQVRYDFWSTMTDRYAATFYKKISDWCHRHQLIFTGHILFEEWLRLATRCEGNIFKHLKHLDLVGVDHIFPALGSEQRPDLHVALKAASSVAHFTGSKRVLCESLAGCGWGVTMRDMKAVADWEYVLGVNLFNPHGGHYSIEGDRKRDFPPCQFYQESWWRYYGNFSEYIARMSYLLTGDEHRPEIGIVYPVASFWQNYTPQTHNKISDTIETDLAYLTDLLLRLHLEFDFIDSDTLAEAAVDDGRLRIGAETYAVLVLPPVTMLHKSSIAKIQELLDESGKVVAFTLLPTDSETVPLDPEVLEFVRGNFQVDPLQMIDRFKQDQLATVVQRCKLPGGGITCYISNNGLAQTRPKELIGRTLHSFLKPGIEISDETIFCYHYRKDGKEIFFLINTTDQPRSVNVTFPSSGIPELWDPDTGIVETAAIYRNEVGKTEFPLEMWPYRSLFVTLRSYREQTHLESSELQVESVSPSEVRLYSPHGGGTALIHWAGGNREFVAPSQPRLETIDLSEGWEFTPEGANVLLSDEWRFMIDPLETGLGDGYQLQGFDDRGWPIVSEGAWTRVAPASLLQPVQYPLAVWYRATVDFAALPDDFRLLMDGFRGEYTVYLNGKEVNELPEVSKIDSQMREIRLTPSVTLGKNTVAIRLVVADEAGGITDKVKFLGTFALIREAATGEFRLAAQPGRLEEADWTAGGFPFYSGTGQFSKEFELSSDYLEKKLLLEVDCYDGVLEVEFNGRTFPTRLWGPYLFDLSPAARDGMNQLKLKVTNTPANLFKGEIKPSGIRTARIVPHHRYIIRK